MAKLCQINRNKKREEMVAKYATKRAALKAVIADKNSSDEEKFEATLKLAKLPRNSSKVRVHNRCELTGRSHGFYRKLKLSRIQLRKLSNEAQVPGMKKSSW
ncbi:MAG: 30S ribosomal protein S14 [Alphaproteobacteria bacterium]|jgi:small subunit ribosomal protein S14|nr:30S ribosomal protein S14 [Alphaproteobacteria bacterium]